MPPGNIFAAMRITVTRANTHSPKVEARAVPLEEVIGMAETPGRYAEQRVELGIRRGHDHGSRAHLREHRALQRGKLTRRDMLYCLDKHRTIEPAERSSRPKERAMEQFDIRSRRRRQRVDPGAEAAKRLTADIQPDKAPDPWLVRQPHQQVAVAAAQIEHGSRPAVSDRLPDRLQPLLMQPTCHVMLMLHRLPRLRHRRSYANVMKVMDGTADALSTRPDAIWRVCQLKPPLGGRNAIEAIMTTLIIINDPPYGTERAYNALRLAHALIQRDPDTEIAVFLMADAVAGARKGQKTPEGFYNIERMLKRVIQKGRVLLCGTCMDARGIGEDEVLDGARRSTMEELAEITATAERVLIF